MDVLGSGEEGFTQIFSPLYTERYRVDRWLRGCVGVVSIQEGYEVDRYLVNVSMSRGRGRDSREGLYSLFRVDCYQGCWLCPYGNFVYTASQPVGSLSS